jgi:hypothetical protein
MEKSDPLCELTQMQTAFDERSVVHADIMNNNAGFTGCTQKNAANF